MQLLITAGDVVVRYNMLLPPAAVQGWMIDSGWGGHSQLQEHECWVLDLMYSFPFVVVRVIRCLFLLSGWPLRCLEDLETGVFHQPCP